jgi:hypothetical protein
VGVFQTREEGEEHCLRHILEVVSVGSLRAVELLGLGLHLGISIHNLYIAT